MRLSFLTTGVLTALSWFLVGVGMTLLYQEFMEWRRWHRWRRRRKEKEALWLRLHEQKGNGR